MLIIDEVLGINSSLVSELLRKRKGRGEAPTWPEWVHTRNRALLGRPPSNTGPPTPAGHRSHPHSRGHSLHQAQGRHQAQRRGPPSCARPAMVFLSRENPTSLPRPCFRLTSPDTPSLSRTDPTSLGHHRDQANLELSNHNAYFIAHCSGHHESVSPSRTGHSMACTAYTGEQMRDAWLYLPRLPGGGQMDTQITCWLTPHTLWAHSGSHPTPQRHDQSSRRTLPPAGPAHCSLHTTHIAPRARRTQTPASTRLLRRCSSRPSPSLLMPRS